MVKCSPSKRKGSVMPKVFSCGVVAVVGAAAAGVDLLGGVVL